MGRDGTSNAVVDHGDIRRAPSSINDREDYAIIGAAFLPLDRGKTAITTPVGGRALERDYETVETDQFPEEIYAALESGRVVTQSDCPKIEARYSWRTNIDKLADWIDRHVAQSNIA